MQYVHVNAGSFGGQKRVQDQMELSSQAFTGHPTWVLGTKLTSSTTRVAHILNMKPSLQLPLIEYSAPIGLNLKRELHGNCMGEPWAGEMAQW